MVCFLKIYLLQFCPKEIFCANQLHPADGFYLISISRGEILFVFQAIVGFLEISTPGYILFFFSPGVNIILSFQWEEKNNMQRFFEVLSNDNQPYFYATTFFLATASRPIYNK